MKNRDKWAKYVSLIFSPVLVPTYCVVMAMWITPLRHISETTRFLSSFAVLLMTALPPMLCDIMRRRMGTDSKVSGAVFVLCQLFAAYYLYSVCAPLWLVMILLAGACVSVVCIVLNMFTKVSHYTCAMGIIGAFVYYLAYRDIAVVFALPWLVSTLLLTGLVASARLKLDKASMLSLATGYMVGAILTYIILNIHLFDQKIPG